MSDISTFQSRTGRVNCSAADFFFFATDMRNLRQFIPHDSISNLKLEREECSFDAGIFGSVKLAITEKYPEEKIVYSGNAIQMTDFSILISISNPDHSHADVSIILSAGFNPVLKMVAAAPAQRLVDKLIDEMENFRGWKTAGGDTQSL